MEPASSPVPIPFTLSPRQRRLRAITLAILVIIALMIVVGLTHPFFRIPHHVVLSPLAQRALKTRAVIIVTYWNLCIVLAFSLFLVAWLSIKEIRRKAAEARRDIALQMAERQRQDAGRPPAG